MSHRAARATVGCALFLLSLSLCACGSSVPIDDDDSAAEDPTPAPVPSAVDEACGTISNPGDPTATEGEIAGLVRFNCYRRLLGLTEVHMDPALMATARNHAHYIDANNAYGHEETDPSAEGYTGQWVADRAAAAGFVYDAIDTDLQEVVSRASTGADAAQAVDLWVNSVYHRTPILRPDVQAVGIGQAGLYDVVVAAAPWEPAGDLQRISLPADGQFGVPTSFDSDTETPDPSPRGVVGYPLNVGVQGPWTGPFEDPHGLRLDPITSSITGPDGAVPFTVLDPSNDSHLRENAFLLPDAPLAPNTAYTVVFSGQADGVDFEITSGFETGS